MKNGHVPVIADPAIELYNFTTGGDWASLTIDNVPKLAAFGWTKLNEGQIVVLGGTNGSLLVEDLWIIDLK